MRCIACNVRLTNREATRKFASGSYCELCDVCLGTIQDGLETFETDVVEEEPDTDDRWEGF